MIRAILISAVMLSSSASAQAQQKLRKVDLLLDVTWAGKRGIQIPIPQGSTQTIKGQCPPVIEMNTKFDPPEANDVDASYSLSDGRVLNRKQNLFMGGLYTEEWEIPIRDPGQEFKGSVTLHVNSPGIDRNDVSVPFAVACAPSAEAAAAECDTAGDSCNQTAQLAAPVRTAISKDPPPMSWSGGTILPGTYVLTGVTQYTSKGMTVTDDGKPSQATVVVKQADGGQSAEMVTTQGACTQHGNIALKPAAKDAPGIAPEYAAVFSGPRAVSLSTSCPASPGGGMAFPAAYSVIPSGVKIMFITGTVMTFTKK